MPQPEEYQPTAENDWSATDSDSDASMEYYDPDDAADHFVSENERSLLRLYDAFKRAVYDEDPRYATEMTFAAFTTFIWENTVPFTRVQLWDVRRTF